MRRRPPRAKGITPSFPALRDQLIAPGPKGEAPKTTGYCPQLPGVDWRSFSSPADRATSALGDEVYTAYMRPSERWRVNRQPALDRADGHCERCGRAGALEVHHLTYKNFTRELPEELQALCSVCHLKADKERKAAWAAQLAKWRKEAAHAHDEARFEGFMRAALGDNWQYEIDPEEENEMRERFEDRYGR